VSEESLIEWTGGTLNPTLGCSKVGRECANCYAMSDAHRMAHNPNPAVSALYSGLVEKSAAGRLNWTGVVRTAPERLLTPFGWAKHKLVFLNSLSDLFHDEVPDDFIAMTFAMMKACDWHVFQVLTKRADRLADLAPRLPWPANVWMGVSVGVQEAAGRVDRLRAVPARVRFLSCEPLLEPLDLDLTGIHWVITGGESGRHCRPFDPAWAADIRDRCGAAGVAFFHKQNGGRNKKKAGRLLDGREHDDMPRPDRAPVPDAAERLKRQEEFRAAFGL